jgi:signal transduction histidine kinase
MARKKEFFTILNTGIILLLLLSGSIYYDYAVYQGKNKQYLSKRFQKLVIEKERHLTKLVTHCSNIDFDSLYQDKSIRKAKMEDIALFVYYDDSLVYWSDNQLSVSKHLHENPFDNEYAKLPNAHVLVHKKIHNAYTYIGLSLIQRDYLYENDYLKNTFAKGFPQSKQVKISSTKGKYPVFSIAKHYLFDLDFDIHTDGDRQKALILFILYTVAFVFFLVFIAKLHYQIGFMRAHKVWGVVALIVDLIVFRAILVLFRLPSSLYKTDYFSPTYFAYSEDFSSLGGFLWTSITFFVITAIFFQHFSFRSFKRLEQKLRYLYLPLFIILISSLLFFITFLIQSLIINSVIPFNLLDVTEINHLSLFGLIIFTLLIFSFVLISYHILLSIIYSSKSGLGFVGKTSLYVLLSYIVNWYFLGLSPMIPVFLLLYYWGFYIILKKDWSNQGLLNSFYFILLFSLFSNFILYQNISYKEKENKRLLAIKLASEKDPLLEYSFRQITKHIEEDSLLIREMSLYPFDNEMDSKRITSHISKQYLYAFEEKYDLLFSICDERRDLDITDEGIIINCQYYFDSVAANYGVPTQSPNLWFIDFGFSESNYQGVIELKDLQGNPVKIFVELFPKYVSGGLGYPELLREEQNARFSEIYNYSWARYEGRKLVHHSGKYFYPIQLSKLGKLDDKEQLVDMDGYTHLIYPLGDKLHIVISSRSAELLSILSLFSYFFIFYSIFGLLLYFILSRRNAGEEGKTSFGKNLQILFITLIISSLFITAISSIIFIQNLNNEKNIDGLSEKAHSVLIELEHKLANEEVLNEEWNNYLSSLLYKFSLVFFSDINLYDISGNLLVSSRPEIFAKALVSDHMNPASYYALKEQKRSLYIQEESIGEYKFLSAYLPLRNKNNEQIAYLNLPYFAKQDEMAKEISGFVASLINIYVILIALSIVATLLLANYISKPIRMLNNRLEKLRLGKENEKILWKRQDEIGKLVTAYNQMVDELEESARLLADSERESAWKDVARQVAHEIKNPLTPMKLSVQFLQKAWKENLPDWEERLQRFTETLIQQIDTLEKIASEFSEFAVMPTAQKSEMNLTEVIQHSIQLFRSNANVKLSFDFSPDESFIIFADENQFNRVFTNLIKNAIQAIPPERDGKVNIRLRKNTKKIIITVEDNGKGISEEQGKKIFQPNFTTKTRGMGIGLSMTRSIIRNQNGKIYFESKVNTGTKFIIELPLS